MLRRLCLLWALSALGCGDDSASEPEISFPEKDWDAEAAALLDSPDWYRHAVFYEIYVRSFQDSDGDGIGDVPGLISRLDYLKELGVDAIWLMPIMPTPFKDSGYDISDYRNVNPDYGTLADFDALLDAAHQRKMRVIMDLVLNHTSDQHAWFQESRTSKDNPKADFYVWSDTPSDPNVGCGPATPAFGDSAWKLDPIRGQYYFHRFYPEQPDLNYRSPAVVQETLDVARFWLDRGVDGFRCDVIGLLYETATECDLVPETKDYIRSLRKLLDEYPGRVMVAEPSNLDDATGYVGNGSDMFHMAFHFGYGYFWGFPFGAKDATPIVETFEQSLSELPPGAQDALVIGSHDVPRAFSTAQGDDTRHQRAALIQLTAKGTPFVYYGEELALRPGTQKIVDMRDAARTPMLWDATAGHGFTTGTPWIAFGKDADRFNLAVESEDPGSMLAFYRELFDLRRGRAVWGTGTMKVLDTGTKSIFALLREDDFMTYVAAVNMTDEPSSASFELGASAPPEGVSRVLGSGKLALDGSSASVALPEKGLAIFRVR